MRPAARASLVVRVTPRASRNKLTRDRAGVLKACLTAPPVEGAANRALVEMLAPALRLPKGRLAVVRGTRSRTKVVSIDGLAQAEVERRLAATLGSPIDKAPDRG